MALTFAVQVTDPDGCRIDFSSPTDAPEESELEEAEWSLQALFRHSLVRRRRGFDVLAGVRRGYRPLFEDYVSQVSRYFSPAYACPMKRLSRAASTISRDTA